MSCWGQTTLKNSKEPRTQYWSWMKTSATKRSTSTPSLVKCTRGWSIVSKKHNKKLGCWVNRSRRIGLRNAHSFQRENQKKANRLLDNRCNNRVAWTVYNSRGYQIMNILTNWVEWVQSSDTIPHSMTIPVYFTEKVTKILKDENANHSTKYREREITVLNLKYWEDPSRFREMSQ